LVVSTRAKRRGNSLIDAAVVAGVRDDVLLEHLHEYSRGPLDAVFADVV